MTIGGALRVLNDLLNADDIPFFYKPSIKAVMETIELTGNKSNTKELEQKSKIGHCKDCKYFEYDSVAKVGDIPLIVAHEICLKWGNGCKTKEDGYCFLFEPQESVNE